MERIVRGPRPGARRWRSAVVMVALMVGVTGFACGKKKDPKPAFTFKAKAEHSKLYSNIYIEVNMHTGAVLEFVGVDPKHVKKIRGTGKDKDKTYEIPAWVFPLGKNTLTLKGKLKDFRTGKTQTSVVKVSFTRRPLPARVTLTSAKKDGDSGLALPMKHRFKGAKEIWVAKDTGRADLTFATEPGANVVFQGKTWKAAKGKTWKRSLDLMKALWDLNPKRISYKGELTFKVKVTSAEGIKEEKTITIEAYSLLRAFITRVRSGKVLASGETPPKERTAILVGSGNKKKGFGFSGMVGTAKKVRDARLFALVTKKRRRKVCGTYRGKSGKEKEISNSALDIIAVVYDRTTGKRVKTKRFRAKMPPCPKRVSSRFSGIKRDIEFKTIRAWLATLLDK